MAYEVRTSVFEGPFDVLLRLVMQEHVDIYEVSVSRIVDGYLAHLEQVPVLDLEAATEFLLVAATLLELKARRLMPEPEDVEIDEELGRWEERDVLLARLLESKTFRRAAGALEDLAAHAARSRPRTAGMEGQFLSLMPDVLAGVTLGDLAAAMVRVMTPRPQPHVDLDHVAPIRASVSDAVTQLVVELPAMGSASFRQLTEGLPRLELILRFLAVLELYKEGLVELEQPVSLGELRVNWLGPAGPAGEAGHEAQLGPAGPTREAGQNGHSDGDRELAPATVEDHEG